MATIPRNYNDSTLERFIAGTLTTMLWCEYDESDDNGGELLDFNYGLDDLAPETIDLIRAHAHTFLNMAHTMLLEDERDPGKWGHDFWLTTHGHGAGFWDGDYPTHGDKLTELCNSENFRTLRDHPYIGDDGLIYV